MKDLFIKCPRCGAEYLPNEIFIPTAFFGNANEVSKDNVSHKIIDYCGTNMDTDEDFTCNYCDTPFQISAKIVFNTRENVKQNFNEDYSTSLIKQSIFLSED